MTTTSEDTIKGWKTDRSSKKQLEQKPSQNNPYYGQTETTHLHQQIKELIPTVQDETLKKWLSDPKINIYEKARMMGVSLSKHR